MGKTNKKLKITMKTSFTTAAMAAIYLALSAEAQNIPRFLQDGE